MQQLTSNVFVETQVRGCNFGFVTTSDGIVMIDSPHKPSTAMWLKAEIEKRGQLRYIINTEPHGDHWTGNAYFDAPVVAHEGVRTRMLNTDMEQHKARVGTYGPEEPALLAGFKPGESTKTEISVKVYDLKDLKDVSHKGTMTVTYTYVGAYEVKVPAGTFNAALFKWHFKGKVGPANREDLQDRFIAKGTGMIAAVDKKNISALLIYHDNSKFGKVLLEK